MKACPVLCVVAAMANAFRIERDAGGVPGLIVAFNVFSEEYERAVFEDEVIYPHACQRENTGKRTGNIMNIDRFPTSIFEIANAVRDSGMLPYYQPPCYLFALDYPHGATFARHYDSRYRWGEVRCLGKEGWAGRGRGVVLTAA